MSLLTQEPRVSVRRTVQLCHGLLAKTPAAVGGAEKQRQVPCCGHENNSKTKETQMLADSQQLQSCEHAIIVSHSNGQCDVFHHELHFRRQD